MKHVSPSPQGVTALPLADRLPTFHDLATFDAGAAWDPRQSRRYLRPNGQTQLPERTQDWIKPGGKVTRIKSRSRCGAGLRRLFCNLDYTVQTGIVA